MNDTPGNDIQDQRSSEEEIINQVKVFSDASIPGRLFDAIPDIFLLLNENRQVVFANKAAFEVFGDDMIDTVYGLRPGEAIKCVYAHCSPGGCGTSDFCMHCGANVAIRDGLVGKSSARECNLLRRDKDGNLEALDLIVWTSQFVFQEGLYASFSVKDISHEKRRRFLERIFFHDILNIAGGIQTYMEYLLYSKTPAPVDKMRLIYEYAARLVNEIQTQRELASAENNELSVHPENMDTGMFLAEIASVYRLNDAARGKNLIVSPDSENVMMITEPTLLGRVIGNMLKNALEASQKEETVTLKCAARGNDVEFSVMNPCFIPYDIQLQIFKRSFSTKGKNRGLGTYSIKLITERYLKGSVFFTSSEESGTVFTISLPRDFSK